ncbi:hypothetical protein [Streptomyces radicis]|uniref:Alanine-rich protein n=1 Tax=Streptomyces radicis TaxID=1750517 RepID=A0A3A9VRG3_9ACTN|nr:hypothetical protein [Streptomyces radicis]RKN03651.1 hypothetical protein D7319_31035 [Streptomyces radicis]RKN13495.1 hypothetical protein D7318_31030 [Streptomyces radicis]
MRAATFLYPWDVVGDPDAARRVADLGVRQATLASAYHSTRALTPRHPRHRVVTARHAAVYYPPDPARWAGAALAPHPQRWVAGADPYGEAAAALTDAGVEVHSWVILAHNTRLGEEHPDITVRNAYGDRYPWAPCVARPEVRDYVVRLAAEAAVRPGARGTELESCGWYGLDHLHAHDKIGGAALGGVGSALMSLCFCDVCRDGYAAHGADPERLLATVRNALAPAFAGRPAPAAADRAGEWAAIAALLGEHADAVAGWRDAVADRLRRDAVAAVRAAAPEGFRVLLHADPAPHRCGANAGMDPAAVLSHADGVVVPCAGGAGARAGALGPFAAHATERTTLAANFPVVAGMGGSPATLAADAADAASLGATELRLYHAGLATDEDLAAVADALRKLAAG